VRGGVLDFYPPANRSPSGSSSSATSSSPSAGTTPHAAIARALDRVAVSPQRELLPDPDAPTIPDAPDRSATIIDYARRARADVAVLEIDDVADSRQTLETQWRSSAADAVARGRVAPPYEAIALGGRP
jgi:hypothetical protein